MRLIQDDGAAVRTICAVCERDTLPALPPAAFITGAATLPTRINIEPCSQCPYCQGWTHA